MKKSVKIIIIVLSVVLLLSALAVIIYPNIEFKKDGVLYACRYSGDFGEFEENASYNELYFYYEKQDVSLKTFDVKNFLFFYLLSFEYEEGDMRESMFTLPEEYIDNWLKNAEITDNEANIDLAKLIEGKTAVVGNTRYTDEGESNAVFYTLDGEYGEMYIFESEGLLVIQVGSVDECPKFIAYK
ncbi:MAG: hypothetical protein IKT46_01085 [Clostridia bacterium]|nr:hypothetical protein [Clostridia bacterium]